MAKFKDEEKVLYKGKEHTAGACPFFTGFYHLDESPALCVHASELTHISAPPTPAVAAPKFAVRDTVRVVKGGYPGFMPDGSLGTIVGVTQSAAIRTLYRVTTPDTVKEVHRGRMCFYEDELELVSPAPAYRFTAAPDKVDYARICNEAAPETNVLLVTVDGQPTDMLMRVTWLERLPKNWIFDGAEVWDMIMSAFTFGISGGMPATWRVFRVYGDSDVDVVLKSVHAAAKWLTEHEKPAPPPKEKTVEVRVEAVA